MCILKNFRFKKMPSKFQRQPRKRKRVNTGRDDGDYIGGEGGGQIEEHSEVVIPTPSIDSVLQNLATNALSKAANEPETDSGDSSTQSVGEVSSDSDSDYTERPQQRQKGRRSQQTGVKRQMPQPKTTTSNQSQQNSSRPSISSNYRLIYSSKQSTSNNQQQQPNNHSGAVGRIVYQRKKMGPPQPPPKATASVNIINRPNATLADMLKQIIRPSPPSSQISASSNKNACSSSSASATRLLPTNKHSNRIISRPLPTTSASAIFVPHPTPSPGVVSVSGNNIISNSNTSRFRQKQQISSAIGMNSVDHCSLDSIDASVNAVVSANASAGGGQIHHIVVPSSSTSFVPIIHQQYSYAPVQPPDLNAYWAEPNTTSSAMLIHPQQPISTLPIQTTTRQRRQNVPQNDEVVVLDSEDEEDEAGQGQEAEEQEVPFCKNCASEIPIILKSLDRLDTAVNQMTGMVKSELEKRRRQQTTGSSSQFVPYNPNIRIVRSPMPGSSATSSMAQRNPDKMTAKNVTSANSKKVKPTTSSTPSSSKPPTPASTDNNVQQKSNHHDPAKNDAQRSRSASGDVCMVGNGERVTAGSDGVQLPLPQFILEEPDMILAENADLVFSIMEHSSDSFDYQKLRSCNPYVRQLGPKQISVLARVLDALVGAEFLSMLSENPPKYAKNKVKFAEWKNARAATINANGNDNEKNA